MEYNPDIHTHFNVIAPQQNGMLNEPTDILLVGQREGEEIRIWFLGDYTIGYASIVREESPYGSTGECIMSIAANACRFFTLEEAEQIAAMIAADEELLRRM
jgi:hypothetical protein